jgi:hypothetical protein
MTTPAAMVSSPSLSAILPMALLLVASSRQILCSSLIVTWAKLPLISFLGLSLMTALFF